MKLEQKIIQIREDDMTVTDMEVDKHFIEFYKKETGRSHVTDKGLSKFINRLIALHQFKAS